MNVEKIGIIVFSSEANYHKQIAIAREHCDAVKSATIGGQQMTAC